MFDSKSPWLPLQSHDGSPQWSRCCAQSQRLSQSDTEMVTNQPGYLYVGEILHSAWGDRNGNCAFEHTVHMSTNSPLLCSGSTDSIPGQASSGNVRCACAVLSVISVHFHLEFSLIYPAFNPEACMSFLVITEPPEV